VHQGGIGKQLHAKLTALGADVRVIANRLPDKNLSATDKVGSRDSHLAAFAADADVLAICCSQNNSNIGMVNGEFLSHFKKKGLLIINVARVSHNL
jgi:phosphoglycerate dehydrogenase-like enzyme